MDKIEAKHKQLLQALSTLDESIRLFNSVHLKKKDMIDQYTHDQLYRAFRESMIQRFEFSTELFWKYLQKYLAEQEILPPIIAPAPIIRAAFAARLLNDQEAEQALEMIKDRNRTSHIYKEEIAEELTIKIPKHFQLMNATTQRLKPMIEHD